MTDAEVLRREDSGIGEKVEHGRGPAKKGAIYYTTVSALNSAFRAFRMSKNPLGKPSDYPQEYAPDVLFGVPRGDARDALELGDELPFHGKDYWNAWELTWLDDRGQPKVGTATLAFDAASPQIVESKSLKLYLGSFAMTRIASDEELAATIAKDLEEICGVAVDVGIGKDVDGASHEFSSLPGDCIDDLPMARWRDTVDPTLMSASGEVAVETLHSHLLRSLCPVTGQPDTGSVMIHYRGPRLDPVSFLEYIASFRQMQDFHEACVERIFMDIKKQCVPDELTVYARYNRRGGIDINPFRSDFEDPPANVRLWRQ